MFLHSFIKPSMRWSKQNLRRLHLFAYPGVASTAASMFGFRFGHLLPFRLILQMSLELSLDWIAHGFDSISAVNACVRLLILMSLQMIIAWDVCKEEWEIKSVSVWQCGCACICIRSSCGWCKEWCIMWKAWHFFPFHCMRHAVVQRVTFCNYKRSF